MPTGERSAIVTWLAHRAGEVSTWRGLVGLAVAVGLLSEAEGQALLSIAVAALGLIEVLRSEGGR